MGKVSMVVESLGIVGSRKLAGSLAAYNMINDQIRVTIPKKIISGGAIGIDSMAMEVALGLGYSEDALIIHLPQPKDSSRAAYIRALFERNGWIVRDSDALLALTIPGGSNGTNDTIRKARALGKRVHVVEIDD